MSILATLGSERSHSRLTMRYRIMLFFECLIILSIIFIGSLATSQPDGATSFAIPRVPTSTSVSDGPAAKRKIFRKFGWKLATTWKSPTPNVSNHAKVKIQIAETTGKVSANPEPFHSQYLCPVKIGGQTLNLDFDTGSSDLWVFSTYLPANESTGHTPFNPRKSSTFRNATGETWSIIYGDGSGASGIVGYDTVNIGGPTVTQQAVELATAISYQFQQDTDSDGILGLGFSRINTVRPERQNTWFQNIKHQLIRPVFSVNLNEDGSGFYQFGVIDRSQVQGNLTKVPVDPSNGFWEFDSPAFAVDEETVLNVQASPAIADTGTSLVIVDVQVAAYYYRQVRGAQYSDYYSGWIYPCGTTLPSFGVSMGSSDFIVTIPSRLMTYGPVSSNYCYGGVQDNNGYELQIYGDLLFRSAFVAFQDFRGVSGTAEFLGLSVAAKE